MWKVQNISVISFLAFAFIVGILVFARGFLLNRTIISEKSRSCSSLDDRGNNPGLTNNGDLSSHLDWCSDSASHSKFVLLLIDALKFDFVERMKSLKEITEIRERGKDTGSFSCSFKFLADPPTTTMQRLKALTTGTMPTFIDASANFNSYEVEEDSLLFQMYSKDKRIAFTGDDTWINLFPSKYFASDYIDAHPSFNAWDLDTVDAAVNKSIRNMFSKQAVNQWDVLIAHILGVDHCGHRYGPNHPEMQRKLSEADEIVKFIYESMDNDTLLVIFGDHGMTDTGDHGGDSRDEAESGLVFVTKSSKAYLSCPKDASEKPIEVSQIDLVPTISALMGTAIPFSSIGQIIPNFLPTSIQNKAVAANVFQINRYTSRYFGGQTETGESQIASNSAQSVLLYLYEQVNQVFYEFRLSPMDVTKEKLFQEASEQYFQEVKSIAKNTWTKFDLPLMYSGILISLLSLICLGLYLISVNRDDAKTTFSAWYLLCPSLTHWTVLITSALSVNSRTRLGGVVISTFTGLIIFFFLLAYKIVFMTNRKIFKHNTVPVCSNTNKQMPNRIHSAVNHFLKSANRLEHSEIIAIILYSLTCLGVFSNSFVINEGLAGWVHHVAVRNPVKELNSRFLCLMYHYHR